MVMAEYVVFAICVFLFVGMLVLIRKRMRVIDVGLGKMRKENDYFQIVESRSFLMKLNAIPEAEAAKIAPNNAAADSSGGEVVPLRKQSPPTAPHAA